MSIVNEISKNNKSVKLIKTSVASYTVNTHFLNASSGPRKIATKL